MKKIMHRIWLSLIMIVSFTVANAQLGIKGGLNLSDLTASGYQANRSVVLGGYANLSINEYWSFQPEIIFSSFGAKQIIPGFENMIYLSYANVPLLLQYKFNNGFRVHSGPQLGILASARKANQVKGTAHELITNVKATDLAWVFGVSYVSYKRVGFDLRLIPGIANISKTPPNVRNNVIQGSVFYQFKPANKHKVTSRMVADALDPLFYSVNNK